MNSLLLAIISFLAFIVAYHTYGKYIGQKIFNLNPDSKVPSSELQDNVDFVPTKKEILFGHHYTSIAGLAPIVGPAIAIIWGWVPALIWVVLGSIFMGAVHDFGALVVSMRAKGRSIGDLVSDLINPRIRQLFLLIIFFLLWIVIAIFALIIALLFGFYPQTVFPVWLEIPIALWLGHESPATTHRYVEADLAMKERALKALKAPSQASLRYQPVDSVLKFLQSL